VQLSHLLGSHTEEHPEIVTLKSQIGSLERQLGLPDTAVPNSAGGDSIRYTGERHTGIATTQNVRQASGELTVLSLRTEAEGQLAMETSDAISVLAKASRERQAADQHLTERMQELSSGPTAAQWSAGSAHVVTRLGGTPRSLTLALAGMMACLAAIAMFRVTAIESSKPRIESADELGKTMALPLVGNLAGCREADGRSPAYSKRWITPARLRIVSHAAEAFVALAAGACLISVVIDPSLAREVLADPFGTLSEVMGRFGA